MEQLPGRGVQHAVLRIRSPEAEVTRPLSLYLDLLRFMAALVVFLDHAAAQRITGGMLWPILHAGPKAVMVFFVLSGFVIAHTVESRDRDPRSFAISRMARIYSVAIPALILTALLDALGHALAPAAYAAPNEQGSGLLGYAASVLFLGEVWSWRLLPGSNVPYWSLNYEVWYYVLFGLIVFLPRRAGIIAAAAILAILGPNIALLLPIWLLGVAAFRVVRRNALPMRVSAALFIGSLCAVAVYEFGPGITVEAPIVLGLRHADVASLYFYGLCTAANIVGFAGVAPRLAPLLERAGPFIRIAAGHSFALYLFHVPLLTFFAALLGEDRRTWWGRVLLYVGTLVAVAALGRLTEAKKQAWRGWFNHLVRHPPRPIVEPRSPTPL